MQYMMFNSDGVEAVSQETMMKANILINTSEGKRVTMDDLLKAFDTIRTHPDAFLEQLYASIEAERKTNTNWEEREGMRGCLNMLKVIEEMRKVMKRMLPEISICETEEEEEKQFSERKQHETDNG